MITYALAPDKNDTRASALLIKIDTINNKSTLRSFKRLTSDGHRGRFFDRPR
jgi:hypothetical protein